jgi:hypothetical protein
MTPQNIFKYLENIYMISTEKIINVMKWPNSNIC